MTSSCDWVGWKVDWSWEGSQTGGRKSGFESLQYPCEQVARLQWRPCESYYKILNVLQDEGNFEIMISDRAICVIYNFILKKGLRTYFGIRDQSAQLPFLQRVYEKNCQIMSQNLCPCPLGSHNQLCGFRNIQPLIKLISFTDRWAAGEDRGLGK